MKLTEKEFKRFNNMYIIRNYITPLAVATIALIYLFVIRGTNLFSLIGSGVAILCYVVALLINVFGNNTILVTKD